MRKEIEVGLGEESSKHIQRYFSSLQQRAWVRKRYQKRTGNPAGQPTHREPKHWELDQQFNPFYVRSHAESLAFSIAKKIRAGTYEPRPALRFDVPKASGGTRTLSIFTVVDSAVSTWLFKRLLERNAPSFSAYSYAYRLDRNAHHAIEHLAKTVSDKQRVFVLEYDFKRYFDSINHGYLTDVLERHIKVSPNELKLLKSFMAHRYAGQAAYQAGSFKTSTQGFPQGTAISLFFANVACMELDREIEGTGAAFARYADDTLIVCDDYASAHRLAAIMLSHSKRSGAQINLLKSEGISLLSSPGPAEFESKQGFVFLGHEISSSNISPSRRSVARIKRHLSEIIYKHLLLYPKRGEFNPLRINPHGFDWDLVTCINELRRYLYGRVSAAYLADALIGAERLVISSCALSHFPLVALRCHAMPLILGISECFHVLGIKACVSCLRNKGLCIV
ncbi:MAG TPA: reverse transcriptase domain-containing protein [Candidatus Acidoferrales bacterium]|jgi:RNA-directed DNA polymerase|nr:reverse transcriptase domain-containing protein [Candidatus Acidoferrales bacterium]